MKFIFVLMFLGACGKNATSSLPPSFVANQESDSSTVAAEAESNFKSIIRVQEEALSSMKESSGGFQMKEMITDIAVAKSGVLGLSAMKANNGVEIWWAKKNLSDKTPVESADLTIDEDMNTETAASAIAQLAETSVKGKIGTRTRASILRSLNQIQRIVDEAGQGLPGHWQFKGIRFDLNFSINGEVLFFTKAGTNLRLRIEWNYTKKPQKLFTPGSRFVAQTLAALNQVQGDFSLPGFAPKMISIGVGTTYKGQLGIWKASPGFIGWLQFIPKETKELSVPNIGTNEDFILGGFEEKGLENRVLSFDKMVLGLRKSLKTAAFFADASRTTQGHWYVSMIRTQNDVSYTGLFGLSDFTTKGVMEIDLRRNN